MAMLAAITSLPAFAFVYEGINYDVVSNEEGTCEVGINSGASGDVVIPSVVYDNDIAYNVMGVRARAFYQCAGLSSIDLPASLTIIGSYAFSGCSGLTTIALPSGLTSIGQSAFYGCSGLTSIVVPEGLTSIESSTFCSCSGLTSIVLPSGLTALGNSAFRECSSLTSIALPSGLTSIGEWAFYHCSGLTSIALPSGVTSIGYRTFTGCYGLTTIELPSGLISIGERAFSSCDGLTTIYLPSGLTSIGEAAFRGCGGLTTIDLPAGLTSIGEEAFQDCTSLTTVTLPSDLTSISSYIFSGCHSLTSIALPSGVTSIGNSAFIRCSRLTTIAIPAGLTSIGDHAFYDCDVLTSIDLPSGLISIGVGAFQRCSRLTFINYGASQPIEASEGVFSDYTYTNSTLTMPNATLADIRATTPWNLFGRIEAKDGSIGMSPNAGDDFEYEGIVYTVIDPEAKTCKTKDGSRGEAGNFHEGALVIPATASDGLNSYTVVAIGDYGFYDNSKLTSVTIPDGVVSIGEGAFEYCTSLTSIIVPEGVTSIGLRTFDGCTSLISIGLPVGITSIGDIAFQDCSSLTSISLPDALSSIGNGAFDGCSSLTAVTIPDGVKAIATSTFMDCTDLVSVHLPDGLTYIGTLAFSGCHSLATINLGAGLTAISNQAFNGCRSLTSLILPDALTSIGFSAFSGCSNLGSIDIPEGVTVIANYTFEDCSGLTSLTLPAGITSIGDSAFSGCDALISVNYGAVQPVATSDNVFSAAAYANATLKTMNAALADVQATVPWNLFGRIVAKDGSVGISLSAGDDFEYQGIIYTVTDSGTKTCRTKDGVDGKYGNSAVLDLVIPQTASDGIDGYTVTAIGQYGFTGCGYLNSVTLPASVEEIGAEAFADCPRLTSLVWQAGHRLSADVTDAIANPNLLVYVTGEQYAPEGMDRNVVVIDDATGTAECRRLVLETGYPFGAVRTFDALYSSLTKEFTQTTPIGGCAGWETIVLPFDATSVAVDDARGELTPFALITDIMHQYPYWLCEAESGSEWKEAAGIKAGVPYLIAMPNNEEYASRYRISGPVTFSNPGRTAITPEATAPYSVTWASGHEFRSLWLPLDAGEAADAMGLNVGIDNLTNDEGGLLAPGSAFHVDVEPRPLEAYVTRQGGRRALPVMHGGATHLAMMEADSGLTVTVENGTIYVRSVSDRHIDIFRVDGARFGTHDVKAGEILKVEGLARGVYIVGGHKVMIM